MAMGLNTTVLASIVSELLGSNDLGFPKFNLPNRSSMIIQDGAGDYQCNKIFADTRLLGPAGTENLDLAAGISDPFGVVMTFLTVKVFALYSAKANSGDITIGNAASNGFVGWF